METVTFDPDQVDYILTALLTMAACISAFLGFNAWESVAK